MGALGLLQGILPRKLGMHLRPARGSADPRATAKHCILLWLDGGPSHLDLFDPKPDASPEVRGPMGSIETAVPGIYLSELLPRTAQVMRHVTILRSMTSNLGEHNLGSMYLLTGKRPSQSLEYPSLGSVVARFGSAQQAVGHPAAAASERKSGTPTEKSDTPITPSGEARLPPYIAIPSATQFAGAGFLAGDVGPFSVGDDPKEASFQIKNLEPFEGMSHDRLERRRRLLSAQNRLAATQNSGPETTSTRMNPTQERAFALTLSPTVRQAFDLSAEEQTLRGRYGHSTIGQSCLLARRLVEAHVPFVFVHDPGWDTHEKLGYFLDEGFKGGSVGKGRVFDSAFACLVTDLHDRGLLDSTLVIAMGEFGRTPKINQRGGRDHWPRVFSVVLAGGGIAAGQTIGASDAHGESPFESPIRPEDLAASVFSILGIPTDELLVTPDGRGIRMTDGNPIAGLT